MEKDFLAVCMIGAGSSWGRANSVDEAARLCELFVVDDWGSIFKLDGQTVTISCYDVTGNDIVRLEYTGLIGDNEDNHPIKFIEHREVTLKVRKRR
jgi:hypothetical protein